MKIKVDKSVLLSAVTPAMGSISTKNTIAAIEGILVKADADGNCTLTAYDLEKGFRTTIPAEVEEEGSYIINANKLNQILRTFPEEKISIDIDERNTTKIKCGRSVFELHALNGEDFPNLPELTGENGFSVKQSELKSMISQILFAVAQNDQRPALNGAYFEIENDIIKIVSCDGNRLALRKKKCDIEHKNAEESISSSFIVPGKTLTELLKLLDDGDDTVNIILTRKHVIFVIGDILFFSRLIDSEYIDYDRFIPKSNKITVSISCDDMITSLERASLVTEDRSMGQTKSPLRCKFEGNLLKISSVSVTGRINDEVVCTKDGDDIEIGFNCRYLLDALKSCDKESIKLSLSTPLMSMLIEPTDNDPDDTFVFLVLPVKMKE